MRIDLSSEVYPPIFFMVELVIVNKSDEKIGLEDKLKCHFGKGILHRAFSIFIFNNKKQLLIQKRSKLKLLWPLYWSNSCCSHPYKDKNLIISAEKRLKRELGFSCKLKFLDKFYYHSFYKNIGSENEITSILVGKYSKEIKPNPEEVSDWKWINLDKLKKDIAKNPQKYTPWFEIALKKFIKKDTIL